MSISSPAHRRLRRSYRFRGQVLSASRVHLIRELVRQHRKANRGELARRICQHFGWRRPNGELRVPACRVLLKRMEEGGDVRLPARKSREVKRSRDTQGMGPPEHSAPEAPILAVRFGGVEVRPIRAEEVDRWRRLMARHHYLGDGGLVGEQIRYVAAYEEQWLALLGWSAAALHNRPRDTWIGWDLSMKFRRLHLVANNARFLILPWVDVPNMASHVLGKNVRRLSKDWEARYGHRVLLVETFVDTARYRGTCYRAANWLYQGQTKGMGRHGTAYTHHGRPKGVWCYALESRALEKLRSPFPGPETMEQGGMATQTIDVNRLPLEGAGGLLELLRGLRDPRKKRGVRHPFHSVLALSVMAVISGMRSYDAIADWAHDVPKEVLVRLRCWRHQAPSEPTFRRVLSNTDASEVDAKVGAWLLKQESLEGQGVALDGKTLRGSRDGDKAPVHLLAAITHQGGLVIAQREVGAKTNEIPESKPLLADIDMEGAVATADALHTQSGFARTIVEEKKADYVLVAKDNQPTLADDIRTVDWDSFSPSGHNFR